MPGIVRHRRPPERARQRPTSTGPPAVASYSPATWERHEPCQHRGSTPRRSRTGRSPRAGSGQSKSSRTAGWDSSRLDQPADRVSDGLTKRCGFYAAFGSGDRVVEPRVPPYQLNAFAVSWVMPPLGQPTVDGVDGAGGRTDHRPGQDQVGEPSPGDLREDGEDLVPVDVMSRHEVPAWSPPGGEHAAITAATSRTSTTCIPPRGQSGKRPSRIQRSRSLSLPR
jgi:hypothetical protein